MGKVKYRVGPGEMNRPHDGQRSLVFRFPAKIRAALRVGAAPAPRRVATSSPPCPPCPLCDALLLTLEKRRPQKRFLTEWSSNDCGFIMTSKFPNGSSCRM